MSVEMQGWLAIVGSCICVALVIWIGERRARHRKAVAAAREAAMQQARQQHDRQCGIDADLRRYHAAKAVKP